MGWWRRAPIAIIVAACGGEAASGPPLPDGGATAGPPRADTLADAGATDAGTDASTADAAANMVVPSSNCMRNDRPPFELLQNGPPPIAGQAAYDHYPITQALTLQADALVRASGDARRQLFVWANRCLPAPGNACRTNAGNLPQLTFAGEATRFAFTTIARANACTLAQVETALFEPAAADAIIETSGLRVARATADLRSAWLSSAVDARGNALFEDVCLLEHHAGAAELAQHLDGIALDYEVQDGRSTAVTTQFTERLGDIVHRAKKDLLLWTNALTSPGAAFNGLAPENGPAVANAFDAASILYHDASPANVAAELDAQARVWSGGPTPSAALRAKLYVIFDLTGTGVAAARATRGWVLDRRAFGVAVWRDGAQIPSSCPAPGSAADAPLHVVRCLAYGEC